MTTQPEDNVAMGKILHMDTHTGLHSMDTPLTGRIYRQAGWLGIVAGFRSMLPLALLAWSQERAEATAPRSTQQTLTGLLAIGEIVGDKLPATPSRLKTGPLLGRIAIGATAGALLCRRYHQPLLPGAIRGAIGAAVGSFAGYSYRTLLGQSTNVPDVVWAVIEDAAAFGLGRLAVRSPEEATTQESARRSS